MAEKMVPMATGEHIGYETVTVEECGQLYQDDSGDELALMYDVGGRGFLSEVSNDFHRLTGEGSVTMKEYLKKYY